MTNLTKKPVTDSNFRLGTRQFLLFETYSKKKNVCGHANSFQQFQREQTRYLGLVTKVGY